MATKIQSGSNAAGLANVDANYQLAIKPANPVQTDGTTDVNAVGSIRVFSEVDNGEITGTADILSVEVDDDYRNRVALDTPLDTEIFNYTAQNTGKHTFTFTTLAATITAAGITTNSGQVNTTNIGLTFGTHAMFTFVGNQTLTCETTVAFTAQPTTDVVVDFGLFQRGVTTLFAPTDGVYFRLNPSGLQGIVNYANVEVSTGVFPLSNGAGTWAYTNNNFNRFLIQVTNNRVTFWINNTKAGEISTPVGQSTPFLSQTLPWSFRHANTNTTGDNTFRALFRDYKIGTRGTNYGDNLGVTNTRALGSYQGISGNTMGQLVAGTVTSGTLVKPTAAVPLNASLAANLPNSLGGRIYEALTAGLAVNVDGIFASFTVPAGTVLVQGKRLKVTGVKLSGFVSTVVAGGSAVQTEWYIAFGHTADSMATAESASMATATTKAPRRVMLPELTTTMSLTQAAGTLLVQPSYVVNFMNPIYVNPGERIALVGNKTGTVPTSGVLSFTYQFDYSWE